MSRNSGEDPSIDIRQPVLPRDPLYEGLRHEVANFNSQVQREIIRRDIVWTDRLDIIDYAQYDPQAAQRANELTTTYHQLSQRILAVAHEIPLENSPMVQLLTIHAIFLRRRLAEWGVR